MKIKILDMADGMSFQDCGQFWAERYDDPLPVMENVDTWEGTGLPRCNTEGCKRPGVIRFSEADKVSGLWYHYCEFDALLILRSSAILEVRP